MGVHPLQHPIHGVNGSWDYVGVWKKSIRTLQGMWNFVSYLFDVDGCSGGVWSPLVLLLFCDWPFVPLPADEWFPLVVCFTAPIAWWWWWWLCSLSLIWSISLLSPASFVTLIVMNSELLIDDDPLFDPWSISKSSSSNSLPCAISNCSPAA